VHLQHEKFCAWLEQSDNATHFKSKENLNFWSKRPSQEHCNFLRSVWVEYGCPGHGKGPWDGLDATVKTKVTTDITNGNKRFPSGKIMCALTVAQHLRAVFNSQELMSVHMDMKINLVFVMYLDIEEILRPVSAPMVSVCKGILTAYSFLFFGTPRHYAMRKFSCWCHACSRVRGRGPGNSTVSRVTYLDVPNCARNNLTVWREDHFTVTKAAGIEEQKKRVAVMIAKELTKAKPGSWGCVQTREMWSTDEQVHLRPGHHCF